MCLRIGDPCRYQPIGSSTPHIPCTVIDIRVKRKPGVYGETITRIRIGRGRGGWVNAERIFPA